MMIDMALFAYLAYKYTYVNLGGGDSASIDTNENIPMEEKPSKSNE